MPSCPCFDEESSVFIIVSKGYSDVYILEDLKPFVKNTQNNYFIALKGLANRLNLVCYDRKTPKR